MNVLTSNIWAAYDKVRGFTEELRCQGLYTEPHGVHAADVLAC